MTHNTEEADTFSNEEVLEDREYEAQDLPDSEAPLDLQGDRKLITQPYDYSIRQIVDEINRGGILLDVSYQRQYVWDDGKASRLIESLLLNVPIPVVYIAEDDDFSFEVIDGLQRLTTLRRFLDDDFALTGVTVLKEIRGKKFSQLTPKDQRRLANRTIRCIAITAESHPDIKFDVFERLNTNVAVLTAQEIRNCVYRGAFNDSLRETAKYDQLHHLVGKSGQRRMVPDELVLRFFALKSDLSEYKPPLTQFVNSYMRTHRRDSLSESDRALFHSCVDTAITIFGPKAFQVPDRLGNTHNTVNKALFDAVMICLATCDRQALAEKVESKTLIEDLLANDDFRDMLGRATADRTRMYGRIRYVGNAIEGLGIEVAALDSVGRSSEPS